MSWESSLEYYRLVNEGVKKRLGGLHSAKVAMVSVDFEPIEKMQHAGDWPAAADALIDAAKRIEAAGADFLLICTNTMHKVADEVAGAIGIPLLHIVDAAAEAVKSQGLTKIGLLGTQFTMTEDFYGGRLRKKHGIEVAIPDEHDRETVHRVIYKELCLGVIRDESRQQYVRIIDDLASRGAEGVVLGCTEIPMLVGPDDVDIPLFDTTALHVEAALTRALS